MRPVYHKQPPARARVSFRARVSPQDLISVVEQAGYATALPAPAAS